MELRGIGRPNTFGDLLSGRRDWEVVARIGVGAVGHGWSTRVESERDKREWEPKKPFLAFDCALHRERKLERGGEYRLSAMEDKWGLWCRLRGCPLAVHVSVRWRFVVWPELLFDEFFPFSGSVISTRAVLRSARLHGTPPCKIYKFRLTSFEDCCRVLYATWWWKEFWDLIGFFCILGFMSGGAHCATNPPN